MRRLELEQPITARGLAAQLPTLVEDIPVESLRRRRWFAGKSRTMSGLAVADQAVLLDTPPALLALVIVTYAGGASELYQLPLIFLDAVSDQSSALPSGRALLEFSTQRVTIQAFDALEHPAYGRHLFHLIGGNQDIRTRHGVVYHRATELLEGLDGVKDTRMLAAEQSNTSIVYDETWILKSLRKIDFGRCRDYEISHFLSAIAHFPHVPAVGGRIEYVRNDGERATLALLQRFVPNGGDGWRYALEQLSAFYGGILAGDSDARSRNAQDQVKTRAAPFLRDMQRLGQITGEMHRALASTAELSGFSPEPVDAADVAAWVNDLQREVSTAFASVEATRNAQTSAATLLEGLQARQDACLRALDAAGASLNTAPLHKIQIHGDYHLGQVLKTESGFVIVDFEGEPARPLETRWAKQSPLEDVAGMLRSFDYAAYAGLRQFSSHQQQTLLPWAELWVETISDAYLEAYTQVVAGSGLVPESPAVLAAVVRFFQLDRAFYELNYELNNRPDWLDIPLRGIERLTAGI